MSMDLDKKIKKKLCLWENIKTPIKNQVVDQAKRGLPQRWKIENKNREILIDYRRQKQVFLIQKIEVGLKMKKVH